MTFPTHANHLAFRDGSPVLHIITGVSGWYPGMVLTTECGIKREVSIRTVTQDAVPATTCKRCLHILGWDL